MKVKFKVSIVIPVMNEEGNLQLLIKELKEVMKIYPDYEIIFIDDGSSDRTLEILREVNSTDPIIRYLSFSKNFGHQNALKAGIDYAQGDCVISMDGDLQHPPELITKLIEKWLEGYDIVNTLRKDDPKTGFYKKLTSRIFYNIINKLSDIEIEQGSADFRLLDRSVVEIIRSLQETPLFIRGIVQWLGFRQFSISYIPKERFWGRTKYSISKMFSFSLAGITSFSVKPLHFSTKLGLIIAILAFIYGVYALYAKLFTDTTIEGWTSLLIVMSFIGGIQLIMIGILGEYLGKLFMSQKSRPYYIIKEKSND